MIEIIVTFFKLVQSNQLVTLVLRTLGNAMKSEYFGALRQLLEKFKLLNQMILDILGPAISPP